LRVVAIKEILAYQVTVFGKRTACFLVHI